MSDISKKMIAGAIFSSLAQTKTIDLDLDLASKFGEEFLKPGTCNSQGLESIPPAYKLAVFWKYFYNLLEHQWSMNRRGKKKKTFIAHYKQGSGNIPTDPYTYICTFVPNKTRNSQRYKNRKKKRETYDKLLFRVNPV